MIRLIAAADLRPSRALLLLVALMITACGKDAQPPGTPEAAPEAAPAPSAAPQETAAAAPEPAAPAGPVTYVPLQVNEFLGGAAIEILVPDDVTIPEDSLIEYREGEDGKLYFESVLPQ